MNRDQATPVDPVPASTGGPRLTARTYLAPGLPRELFQLVAQHLACSLGCEVVLEEESRTSGPMQGESDPFADGSVDIGFLCAPSFLYLQSQPRPSVELVPAGFAFHDERARGQPVYFSEAVVRADHGAREFLDLAGSRWGYNDGGSLSGHFATLQALAHAGRDQDFFGSYVQTGSHDASVKAILAGAIDGAAIDSIMLARLRRERPQVAAQLRVLESWGPFPIQPVVVRRGLGETWPGRVAEALLQLHATPRVGERLRDLGLERCVPIDEGAYAQECAELQALGHLPCHLTP